MTVKWEACIVDCISMDDQPSSKMLRYLNFGKMCVGQVHKLSCANFEGESIFFFKVVNDNPDYQ